MPRRRSGTEKVRPDPGPETHERWLWRVVALLVLAIPLMFSPSGKDLFNLPKDILFRAGMIAIAAILVMAWPSSASLFSRRDWRKPSVAIALGALAWTAVAAVFSSDRGISAVSLATTAALTLFYLLTLRLAVRQELQAIWLLLVPAILNALMVMMQESGLQPLNVERLSYDPHLSTTGFLGNPNVAGAFLTGPALAAVALAVATRGRRRYVALATAAVLLVGILASRTLTSLLAYGTGMAAMVAVSSWRMALKLAAPALIAAVIFINLYAPLRYRVRSLIHSARTGEYNLLLTNRLTPFLAAGTMAADHPLLGIGPGTFGHHYFDYKILAEARHPGLVTDIQRSSWSFSFSEVHNDHLEVLAETGLPGYLLFLGALFILAAGSLPELDQRLRVLTGADPPVPSGDSRRLHFARILALPLVASFFVLALAQFPLQLISTATAYLFLAALCRSWCGW
ncbi:MAG: O-antigen ligase family protein [Acidobacteriota bacterium]